MVRDYGFVVTDKTAWSLAIRAAPSVASSGYLGSTVDYAVMNGFPWEDLALLTVGSDAVPTPTAS
jgi:hypothetical protein